MSIRIILATICGVATYSSAEAQSCLRRSSYVSGYDYVYCGAEAVNKGAGYIAGRLVPGGNYAYKAGNYIGERYYDPSIRPQPYAAPPRVQQTYYPPAAPFQYRQYAPTYPNYGPVRRR